jgi:hypothetical protein
MLNRPTPSSFQVLGITVILAVILVGLVSLGQLITAWDPEKPFRDQQMSILSTLTEDVPPPLTFSSPGQAAVFTEPDEIREFIFLLIESEHLGYHHSNPEGEFVFSFEGHSERYTLGLDTQNPDEYWFQLVTEADLERRYRPTIKLLYSQALTSWLVATISCQGRPWARRRFGSHCGAAGQARPHALEGARHNT